MCFGFEIPGMPGLMSKHEITGFSHDASPLTTRPSQPILYFNTIILFTSLNEPASIR